MITIVLKDPYVHVFQSLFLMLQWSIYVPQKQTEKVKAHLSHLLMQDCQLYIFDSLYITYNGKVVLWLREDFQIKKYKKKSGIFSYFVRSETMPGMLGRW